MKLRTNRKKTEFFQSEEINRPAPKPQGPKPQGNRRTVRPAPLIGNQPIRSGGNQGFIDLNNNIRLLTDELRANNQRMDARITHNTTNTNVLYQRIITLEREISSRITAAEGQIEALNARFPEFSFNDLFNN